jgi:arabinofuranan 3-O-arabinosyltransferase
METWLIDQDFANCWTAARLVLDGHALDLFADHATYFRHLTDTFGPDYPWRNWSYPPHFLLAIWPVGFLGYVPALVVFLAVTLMAYGLALRAFVGRLSTGIVAPALILGPAIMDNIYHAQNGFLTGALMLGGLALRTERPVLAGVLFGCLTIKPQLGLLIPLLLLAERQWRVIASAALTTAALVGLSGAVFGWEAWHGYLAQTLPYQSRVMTEFTGIFLGMMPTVFGALRSLHVEPDIALAAHGAVAVVALFAAGWTLWLRQDPGQRAAVTIMATLVVAPYWLSYDYSIAAAALLLSYQATEHAGTGVARGQSLLLISAFSPLVAIPLWMVGLPLTPLLILIGFWAVLQTAWDRKG